MNSGVRCVCLLCALVFCATAGAQEHPEGSDAGINDAFADSLNIAADASAALGVPASLADLSTRARQIETMQQLGLADKDAVAGMYFQLAMTYYKARRYVDAIQFAQMSVDSSPQSYASLQSMLLTADTYYGNMANPSKSIKVFQQADELLVDMLADERYSSEKMQVALLSRRATVLGRLGMASWMSGKPDDSIAYFRELTETPELATALPPDSLLIYTRQLGRVAGEHDQPDIRDSAYAAVQKLLESGQISMGKYVRNRIEIIRATWPNPDASQRIRELQKLWDTPEYSELPELIAVGDELAMHYFYAEPRDAELFSKFSTSVLERLRSHFKKAGETGFTIMDGIYVRQLLMAVEVAQSRKDKETSSRLIQEFETRYRNRPIKISLPTSRSEANWQRLNAVYRENMVLHIASVKGADGDTAGSQYP